MIIIGAKFTITSKGSYKLTEDYLEDIANGINVEATIRYYGEKGVEILKKYTPVDSGMTKDSWSYTGKIRMKGNTNHNIIGLAFDRIRDAKYNALIKVGNQLLRSTSDDLKFEKDDNVGYALYFTNSNVTENGIPIVNLLEYGHSTGTGGYVPPKNFIVPLSDKIFKEFSDSLWKEVIKDGN